MPVSEEDLLPTPSNYATPNQLAAVRDYSKALLYGSGQQPVRSWTQGLSNMVSALVGGYDLYKSGQQEKEGMRQAALIPRDISDTAPLSPAMGTTPGSQPQSIGGVAPSAQSANPYSKAISSIESGGKYDELGPVTRTGDRAYGKYQVMGANIGPWTKEILGQQMTPQEFMNNPDAQEKVFSGKFGQYVQKTGNPQDAASMWFTGKPLAQGAGLRDQLGTTGAEYVRRFNAAGGAQPQPGVPMAFNGTPTGPGGNATDAPSAIVQALQGTAGGKPVNSMAPPAGAPSQVAPPGAANGSSTPINPGLAPHRVPVSYDQVVRILSNPYSPPALKEQVMQMYYSQRQPLEAATTGGKVLIDPKDPRSQQFIPDLQQLPIKTPAGVETKLFGTIQGGNQFRTMPIVGAPGATAPGGPGAPPADEAPPALDTFGSRPAVTPPPPPAVPGPQGANETGLSTNALAYNNTGDVASDASPPFPGMLGQGPPPEALHPAGDLQPPPNPKEASVLGPFIDQLNQEGMDQKVQLDSREAQAKKASELYGTKYDSLQQSGQSARQGLSNLQMAKELTYDPTFVSGPLSGPRLDLERLQAWLGKNPDKAAATEIFQKLTSGNIINDMRSSFSGLGQIRLAEINLLSKANANLENTPPANRAVLDILTRVHQQAADVAKLSNSYAQGWRWDAQGKPYRVGDRGLDYGWDQTLQRWTDKHPIFSDDEIKDYNKVLTKFDPKKAAATSSQIQGYINSGAVVPDKGNAAPGSLPPGAVLDK